MNVVWNYVGVLLTKTVQEVGISLQHNWRVLAISILIAVGLRTYVNSDKFSRVLLQKKKVSIIASVLFGAFTPLCACGTTAVLIGMLTTTLPWGPIMAFLTSSPLMSPDGFVFISGVINVRFAIALTVASLFIGIAAGLITNLIEKKTNYLNGQSRYLGKKTPATTEYSTATTSCSCNAMSAEGDTAENDSEIVIVESGDQLCCAQREQRKPFLLELTRRLKLKELLQGIYRVGIKQILIFYVIFIAIGSIINYFIPTSIISILFGENAFYAVPLASLIGLPLYITTNSGIPIIKSLLESGASEGAMLAFIITGSATSAWVIAGLSTFMKRKAIALYIAFVLAGGIISGYVLDLFNLIN
ncbi:MAG: hypothetical protein H6Q59_1158 [Firmicutes bacterium]|nr:hypothetical protein [Bacillota bacterium]